MNTTPPSAGELDILKHICFQIEEDLQEIIPESILEGKKPAEGQEDVRGMRTYLLQLVQEASKASVKVVIIIDALNKIDSGGRAMRVSCGFVLFPPLTRPSNMCIA